MCKTLDCSSRWAASTQLLFFLEKCLGINSTEILDQMCLEINYFSICQNFEINLNFELISYQVVFLHDKNKKNKNLSTFRKKITS